ncbi:MAG: 2-phospho-L-lactate transferase [Deltaproteobacteria bacterium]|nr:2-phospho-L-lactate transferase [Deltaproteobacteria bacterium]MCZ6547004.1 2-phospho-L-lactate transferase [Deltaproteobacteria bacterium]
MLVLLTGGTGGAKLVQGFNLEARPEDLVIICNTADDFVFHGLHISPDLDTITYTMAGLSDAAKGWGIRDDTFVVLDWLGRLGGESWFKLGDRDLATHIMRSNLLREGLTLSQITERIRKRLGIESIILPMSDDRVETRIETPNGEISFQDYFVRGRWRDEVHRITFTGVEKCRPAPGVLDSIREASAVILCPSNPITSIGPILTVPGIRSALRETRARIIAVSPIIRGMPYSGPAHKFMAAMGIEVSAFGVASAYRDFLTLILIALEDSELMRKIEGLGIQTVTTSIRLESLDDRRRVARELLALL